MNSASAQSLILSFPIVTCFGSAHTNLRVLPLSASLLHSAVHASSQQQHGPAYNKTCNALRRIHLGSSSTATLHRRLLVHLALGRPPLTNLQRTSASTAARPIKVSPPIFAILSRTPSQSALKNCDFNYLTPQPPDFSQIDVPAKQGRARLKLTSTKFSCSRPILFPTPANPKRNPPSPTELSV